MLFLLRCTSLSVMVMLKPVPQIVDGQPTVHACRLEWMGSHRYTPSHVYSSLLTLHLTRDDLDGVLRDVEGVVEGDGVGKVPENGGLVRLPQQPHASRTQHVERGLCPLWFRYVTQSKVQERYQTLVGFLRGLYVSGNTWDSDREGGKEKWEK